MSNAAERFELLNELYYQDTGWMRPGKDDRRPGKEANTDENRERFEEWCATKMVRSLVEHCLKLDAAARAGSVLAEAVDDLMQSGDCGKMLADELAAARKAGL